MELKPCLNCEMFHLNEVDYIIYLCYSFGKFIGIQFSTKPSSLGLHASLFMWVQYLMLRGHIYWDLYEPCIYIVIYSVYV